MLSLPIEYIEEPKIVFGHGQRMCDPRDGLSFFGPIENGPLEIRSGVVGSSNALRIFKSYIERIRRPVYNANTITRPFFPGFESVFNCKWNTNTILFKEVTKESVMAALAQQNRNIRTYDAVTLFLNPILRAGDEDSSVNMWFVIVPDEIYQYCRPKSAAPNELELRKPLLTKREASKFVPENWLFAEMRKEDELKQLEQKKYLYDAQFHDQFKARLLERQIPTQIIRESTLDWQNYVNSKGKPIRNYSAIEGHLAWTLSTTVYYKAGGKPWQLSDVRPGVCYLGLVYKKYEYSANERYACCAAQMFLNNGDGTIFKGELGPWYNPKSGEFHLQMKAARSLLQKAVESYRETTGNYPKELFIHARTHFNNEEWSAFLDVVPTGTRIVGITIDPKPILKLYRLDSRYPIMRGMLLKHDERRALLWTKGFVPRIQTALGLETPSPLDIRIDKGDADIDVVVRDILALTKLNYNACLYGDGLPVTLRFADKIGNILTATAEQTTCPPLSFKFYI